MAEPVQPDADGETVTQVDRLTLVSEVGWLNFEPPIFVQAGESFWVVDRTLYVLSIDGDVRSAEARASRPTDRR